MHVTIQPAAVTALGNAARHIGESVLGRVPVELRRGHERVGSARIDELGTKGVLDLLLPVLVSSGERASGSTVSVGAKLVTTVHVYTTADGQSGGLFRAVDSVSRRGGQ